MCCSACNEVRARSKVSIKRPRGLCAKSDRCVEFVRSEQGFALGVIDEAAFDARGSRCSDPTLEAARPARRQEVIERCFDCLDREGRIVGHFGNAQRFVPPTQLQELEASRKQSLPFLVIGLPEAANQQLAQERMERE